MWTCPLCGRRFAARQQVHTCAHPVDDEFRGWLAAAYDVGQQRHHRTAG